MEQIISSCLLKRDDVMTEIIVKSYFFAALCEVAKTRNGNVTFISFCSLLLTFLKEEKIKNVRKLKLM